MFRLIAGVFLGGIVASINVLVAEYGSNERRGTVMGIYGIGFPLGAAIGGFLSIWLVGHFGWQGPCLFSASATLVMLIWASRALPESVGYLVEKHPEGALDAYNAIGAKLDLAPDTALPAPTSAQLKPSLRKEETPWTPCSWKARPWGGSTHWRVRATASSTRCRLLSPVSPCLALSRPVIGGAGQTAASGWTCSVIVAWSVECLANHRA